MTCSSCGEHPKHKDNSFTKAVIEINNPETLTLLRKVVIPTSMGDEEAVPPAIGKYHNVLLYYEINKHTYIYSSDGIPTLLEAEVPQEVLDRISNLETGLSNEIINREGADTALDNRLTTVEGIASTAVQPAAINKVVMTDIALNTNTSTTTVQIDGAKENLLTGAQTTKNLPLPVASSIQAGVMNSSTFDAITNNTSDINAMMNGAVAITGLSASPSQADLTTAWETETGLATLMNRAGIYDVTNNKVWTYYINDTTWHEASNSTQVTINTFTNSSEGVIKGSTSVGQVFAESNGTGSVNGWDSLSAAVADNTANKLASANLTVGNGLVATTTGSGASTAIDIAFADKAVNTNIWTASNLSPATDDLAGWQALLGNTQAVYWTVYSQENCFTNQPNKWGFLETIIEPSEIYQRWHSQSGGGELYRAGNHVNGWYGHNGSGAFRSLDVSGLTGTGFHQTEWTTLWDYFNNDNPTAGSGSVPITSKHGNIYTVDFVNYNTGGAISAGGSHIYRVRGGGMEHSVERPARIAFRGTSSTTPIYGVISNTYLGNAAGTANHFTLNANTGHPYSNALTINSAVTHTTLAYTFTAQRNVGGYWLFEIDFMTRGMDTTSHISARVQAGNGTEARYDVVPGIYIPGTGDYHPDTASSWYEILEPNI